MTDLDAIRARDAASSWGPEDALQACLDRRALLAEVDRLRSVPTTVLQFGPDHPFSEVQHTQEWFDQFTEAIRQDERARALPVIEAARAAEPYLFNTPLEGALDRWEALRAALAEYDR